MIKSILSALVLSLIFVVAPALAGETKGWVVREGFTEVQSNVTHVASPSTLQLEYVESSTGTYPIFTLTSRKQYDSCEGKFGQDTVIVDERLLEATRWCNVTKTGQVITGWRFESSSWEVINREFLRADNETVELDGESFSTENYWLAAHEAFGDPDDEPYEG